MKAANPRILTSLVGLLSICPISVAGGPIVPGVKSCVISDALGTYNYSYLCEWWEVCCLAPIYTPCPFPLPGGCIAAVVYDCCGPLEDCWYQRQGNKLVVWCGPPFPP